MKTLLVLIFIGVFCVPSTVLAADSLQDYSIQDALNVEKIQSTLGTEVKFYFGNQLHGKVLKKYGEFKTSKKANAFMKSKESACQWAFASSLKALKDRALREGGNAVINIRSNYNNNQSSSAQTFQCGAGTAVAGVALIGDVVKLAQ